MNYLLNKEGLLRAMTFFKQRNDEKAIFSSGDQIKPIPSELYVNKEVKVGGGKVSLLIGSTDNEIGVTNFDGNKLDDGRAFAVDGISFKLGIAKSGTKPYNVDFATGVTKAEKAAFQFANIVLKQNNEILVRLPISSIENGKQEFGEYRDLDLTLITPRTKVEIEIEFPDEVEAPTLTPGNSIFVSTVFRGYESYQRR
ncbi:hypothetical protein [uncultured Tenacibaculum sp.]|uniref:hypothetical protein n=1 Tax=uncultured Tenacibaculum sp. TaxID=174713 RepID=UPI002627DCE6|nr:hypothetical protein [uncultured Tenacibaculum sp.]